MEIRRSEMPADPFFAALRRRHPDVDLVVLPSEPPPPATLPVSDDVVLAELARITSSARERWPGREPEVRVVYGGREDQVRARARVGTQTLTSEPMAVGVTRARSLVRHGLGSTGGAS